MLGKPVSTYLKRERGRKKKKTEKSETSWLPRPSSSPVSSRGRPTRSRWRFRTQTNGRAKHKKKKPTYYWWGKRCCLTRLHLVAFLDLNSFRHQTDPPTGSKHPLLQGQAEGDGFYHLRQWWLTCGPNPALHARQSGVSKPRVWSVQIHAVQFITNTRNRMRHQMWSRDRQRTIFSGSNHLKFMEYVQ